MSRPKYKGTTFPAGGYKGTIEQFEKEFEGTRDFRSLPPKERKAELKKAFNIAIGKTEEKK